MKTLWTRSSERMALLSPLPFVRLLCYCTFLSPANKNSNTSSCRIGLQLECFLCLVFVAAVPGFPPLSRLIQRSCFNALEGSSFLSFHFLFLILFCLPVPHCVSAFLFFLPAWTRFWISAQLPLFSTAAAVSMGTNTFLLSFCGHVILVRDHCIPVL